MTFNTLNTPKKAAPWTPEPLPESARRYPPEEWAERCFETTATPAPRSCVCDCHVAFPKGWPCGECSSWHCLVVETRRSGPAIYPVHCWRLRPCEKHPVGTVRV